MTFICLKRKEKKNICNIEMSSLEKEIGKTNTNAPCLFFYLPLKNLVALVTQSATIVLLSSTTKGKLCKL